MGASVSAPAGILARQRRASRPLTPRWRRRGLLVQLDTVRGPSAAGLGRVAGDSYWVRAARVMPALARALRVRAARPVIQERAA